MASTNQEYFLHETISGERWDTIAWEWYQNGSLSHVLIKANRHLFTEKLNPAPLVFEAGVELVIPVLEPEKTNPDLLPPWRR